MNTQKAKQVRRTRRRRGIRKRIIGTAERPRLSVYRSLNHIYAQVIDDLAGTTIVSASTRDKGVGADTTGNTEAAAAIGKTLAEKAKAAGVSRVVFDRGGFRYHGRIKALADAAREGGLEF
jgi:large subunit ribosomal protein L18